MADTVPAGAPLARVAAVLGKARPSGDPVSAADPAAGREPAGLVCGEPDACVRTVLFAVDAETGSDEAVAAGTDLLVVQRPPDAGAAAATARLMHRLGAAGAALYVQPPDERDVGAGPSDSLASLLGMRAVRPLRPAGEPVDLMVTSVPHAAAADVIDALAATGAGRIGEYRRCAWTAAGVGTFVPEDSARPTIGEAGRTETVPETRVEMTLPRDRRAAAVAALTAAHPYQEPPYYLCELVSPAGDRGDGRVGELQAALPLSAFTVRAARLLGAAPASVRAAGDPERLVRTVALGDVADDVGPGDECPPTDGADLLTEAARSGAEVFLAGRVPDRLAAEARRGRGPALVEVGAWAAARPWLSEAAARLERGLDGAVSARVCEAVSDPWWRAG